MSRYYSQAHYRRLADVGTYDDGRGAERLAHRVACELARAETLDKFGPLTASNAAAAMAWQAARIAELDDCAAGAIPALPLPLN